MREAAGEDDAGSTAPSARATQRHVVRTFGGVHGDDADDDSCPESRRTKRFFKRLNRAEDAEYPPSIFRGRCLRARVRSLSPPPNPNPPPPSLFLTFVHMHMQVGGRDKE